MQTGSIFNTQEEENQYNDIVGPAQAALQQPDSWNDTVINGTTCRYKLVKPDQKHDDDSSVCLIDNNGNGYLFTAAGCRMGGGCFPIINKTIMSNKYHAIYSELNYADERIFANLIFAAQKNDHAYVIEALNKLETICRPVLGENIVQQQNNSNYQTSEFKNDDYTAVMKTSSSSGFCCSKDEIRITNKFGHGKIFYSNGNVKPIINHQIVDNQFEKKGTQIFSHFKILINNKQPSLFQLVDNFFKKPTITENNDFKTLALKNGFTISIRVNPKQGQKQSIKITNNAGKGYCYYKNDDYVNPVINGTTYSNKGVKKGKQYFDQLDKLIREERYEALNNLCEQLVAHDINDINYNVDVNLYNTSNGVHI